MAPAASSSSAVSSRPRRMQAQEAASTDSASASAPRMRAKTDESAARSSDQIVSRQSRSRCSWTAGHASVTWWPIRSSTASTSSTAERTCGSTGAPNGEVVQAATRSGAGGVPSEDVNGRCGAEM